MKLHLVQSIGRHLLEKSKLVNKLSLEFEEQFSVKNYGGDIEELYIGIISVEDEFKEFFKPIKPKFTKIKKTFEFGIEYDYDEFMQIDESKLKEFILEGILNSLQVISEKVKDFDINAFENDLKQFMLHE